VQKVQTVATFIGFNLKFGRLSSDGQVLAIPVLAGPEPPNQTGGKVMFWSQIVRRMRQLRLWVLWVTDGDIHPLPTFVLNSSVVSRHSSIITRPESWYFQTCFIDPVTFNL
jgi:hypothetical protein